MTTDTAAYSEFEGRVAETDPASLHAHGLTLVELNIGLRCNMECAHCHQSCSPRRTEEMTDDVLVAALAAIRRLGPRLIDVTGGAPELHPHIHEYLSVLARTGVPVQVRTNLTVLLEPGLEGLPGFFVETGVRLLASLPGLDADAVDGQRGGGAFAASIEALRRLNAVGYGCGRGLSLDIAYNPTDCDLPGDATDLEARFRTELGLRFGVSFDRLLVSTNVPVGRFRAHLRATSAEADYLDALRCAFNPEAVPLLSCRDQVVIAWDGSLWDCDYNLGARLRPAPGVPRRVEELDGSVAERRIAFGPHCFACTAGPGSS
jgi:radical SAM/Cys-rich protein